MVGHSLAAPPLSCFGLTFSSDFFCPIGVDAGFCPHNNEVNASGLSHASVELCAVLSSGVAGYKGGWLTFRSLLRLIPFRLLQPRH